MDGVTASRYRNRYQRTGLEKEIDRALVNRIGYVSKEKRLQRNLNRSCCYSLRTERGREREREREREERENLTTIPPIKRSPGSLCLEVVSSIFDNTHPKRLL